jgi:hypothetical protein
MHVQAMTIILFGARRISLSLMMLSAKRLEPWLPDYRCYFLNAGRHIVGVESITECDDDAEARKIAMTLLQERPQYNGIAVWDRSRKVFEEMIKD